MHSKFIFKIALISTCLWQGFCFDSQAKVDSQTSKYIDQTPKDTKIIKKAFVKWYCSKKKQVYRGKTRYPLECVVSAVNAYNKKSLNKKNKF